MLKTLVDGQTIRDWYSVEEFARLVNRAESPAANGAAWANRGSEKKQWPGAACLMGHFSRRTAEVQERGPPATPLPPYA